MSRHPIKSYLLCALLCSSVLLSGLRAFGQSAAVPTVDEQRLLVFSSPHDPAAHASLAQALAAKREWPEAMSQIKLAVRISHNQSQYAAEMCAIMELSGDTEGAKIGYNTLLLRDSANIDAALGLARIYRLVEQRQLAIHYFEVAEALDPLDFNTHKDLGSELLTVGQFGPAETEFEYCLCITPGDSDVLSFLATAQSEQGKNTDAITTLNNILAIPDLDAVKQSQIYVQLGAIMLLSGKNVDAVDDMQKALALCPTDPHVHNALGAALYANGDKAGATDQWKIALVSRDEDAKETARAWLQLR